MHTTLPGLPPGQAQPPSYREPKYGFTARLKFRSTVGTVGMKKTDTALVDSGGTHHFFHSKKFFYDYEGMNKTDVQSATETLIIVGKGKVFLPIFGGVYVEALHTHHFTENILSVSLLSKLFDLLSSSKGDDHELVTCYFKRKGTNQTFHKVEEEDGLFRLNVSSAATGTVVGIEEESGEDGFDCHTCMAATKTPVPLLHEKQALHWHYRTGHPNAERYIRLSQTFPSVPSFSRNTLRKLLCVPCTLALSRRAPVLRTLSKLTHPLELIHVDITGPILASLGGRIYSVSILDGYSGKSDAYFIKNKKEPTSSILEYKAKSELQRGHPYPTLETHYTH